MRGLTALLITILLCCPNFVFVSGNTRNRWWDDLVVIGDAYRIEFFSNLVGVLKEEYGFEALHNTVQAWIDYRDWMRHPAEWDVNIGRLIREAKREGIPVGVAYGYHVGDSVTAPYDEDVGFLHYYRALIPEDKKWKYPNGTISNDPYSVGASRTFSGYYAVRILGSPMEVKMLQRLDFYSTMMPQNPYWKDFFIEWGKKAIDRGAYTFFLDSPDGIFTFFWGGGWGCGDSWEGNGLIKHLKKRFSEEELRRFGIEDINSFCLKDYLIKKYGKPEIHSNPYVFRERFVTSWPTESVAFTDQEMVLQDPVFKEAVIYWYQAAKEFVADISSSLKGHAREKGREVLLSSNNYFSWIPQITLVPYMDVIYVETNQIKPPPRLTFAGLCKLATSAANSSKPVWIGEWILNFVNPFEPDKPPEDVTNLIKIRVAEAYASGCIMLIPFGTGHPDEGWPPKRLINGQEREGVSRYYRFIKENKGIFLGTINLARVAVLVSLPTAVWGFIPALGVSKSWAHGDYQAEIVGWTKALESLHIPYDVLLLGMDGILNTDNADRLGRYGLLIAPDLTHISDGHLKALANYLDNGGRLIITPDFGAYDEMNNRRNVEKIREIIKHRNVLLIESGLGRKYSESFDKNTLETISAVIRQSAQQILSTNAKQTLYINILIQPKDGRILAHLVNYDYGYNATRDYVRSHPRFWLSLHLPETYMLSDVYIISPDYQHIIRPEYAISDNRINITIPQVGVWSIIVIQPAIRVETTAISTTSVSTLTTTTQKIIERTSTTIYTTKTTETKTLAYTETITKTIQQIQYSENTVIVFTTASTLIGIAAGYIIGKKKGRRSSRHHSG